MARRLQCATLQGVCPSGQRERAVNPSAQPTEVRILPPPHASRPRLGRGRSLYVGTRFPPCAPRWVDASRERTMRAKIVRTFRGMTVRVFWYISKTKVDNYAGADRHWTDRLGGHVRVGLPLVEVGVEATGPPDRGLVEKLEHIERRAKHDDGVLSVVEIGAEPPVLFRYEGRSARIVVGDTFWVAAVDGSSAVLLTGWAGNAIGATPVGASKISSS